MRLRQGPMTEASALMGIALIFFMVGMFIIKADISKALGEGTILAALLLFPAFVLWALFARVARDAKLVTRFLVAVAVTMAVSAGGAYLMQPGAEFTANQQAEAILQIGKIVLAFAVSGLIASALVYGLLMKPRAGDDATLLTAPVVPNSKKKKRK